MTLLLDLARLSVAVNLAFLVALGYVWVGSYRRHGATHTLALVVFAGLLAVQNAAWGYLYVLHGDYAGWFAGSDPALQLLLAALCGLETAALAALTWITWR